MAIFVYSISQIAQNLNYHQKKVFNSYLELWLTICVFSQTVIEAASGAGVAAAMSEKMTGLDPAVQNVGVILCGGNVDINNLPWYS